MLIFLFTERTRGGGFGQTHKAATGDFVALYPSFLDLKRISFDSVRTKHIGGGVGASQDDGMPIPWSVIDLRPSTAVERCTNGEV